MPQLELKWAIKLFAIECATPKTWQSGQTIGMMRFMVVDQLFVDCEKPNGQAVSYQIEGCLIGV